MVLLSLWFWLPFHVEGGRGLVLQTFFFFLLFMVRPMAFFSPCGSLVSLAFWRGVGCSCFRLAVWRGFLCLTVVFGSFCRLSAGAGGVSFCYRFVLLFSVRPAAFFPPCGSLVSLAFWRGVGCSCFRLAVWRGFLCLTVVFGSFCRLSAGAGGVSFCYR